VTLRIEIPGLPPAALRGNQWTATSKLMWQRRSAFVSWKTTAGYAIIDARNKSGCAEKWKDVPQVAIEVVFVLKDHRRIDTDNLEGQAMKPVWDAMVEVAMIPDDNYKVITRRGYRAEVDPKRAPMTIVEITTVCGWALPDGFCARYDSKSECEDRICDR
jgi:Holliday junction resolvase RusA-like endonuclease